MLREKIWGGRDEHYEFTLRLYDSVSFRTFKLGLTISWFYSYKALDIGFIFWHLQIGYRTHWASQYDS